MPVIDNMGKPLPDNHPSKGGVAIFGGMKPVPPTAEEKQVTEQAFIAELEREPTATEHWPLIVALKKQRRSQGSA